MPLDIPPVADLWLPPKPALVRATPPRSGKLSTFPLPTFVPQSPFGVDSFTKLLLHCDGANASTSFPDSSGNNYSVTANGSAQVDTSQSVFGGASAKFTGAGDRLSLPSSADWSPGSGDFAVDFWVRFAVSPLSANFAAFVNGGTNGSLAIYHVASTTGWQIARYNQGSDLSFTWSPSAATWYHLAVTRASGTVRVFVNGTNIASGSSSTNYGQNGLNIGGDPSGGAFSGWIDEFRWSKGASRWTSSFTPPTENYHS